MAGILDFFGLNDGPSGGILGGAMPVAQPNWQSRVGLIGAGLADAGAALSGRDENNIGQFRKMQMQNSLRQAYAAAASGDPSARAQAYSAIVANGGDPSALQKFQASQALPQLLQNLQPSMGFNDNPVGITPAVNATGPDADAQRAAAQATNAGPSMSMQPSTLTGALARTGSPELSAEMAPQLIQNQINMQAKSVHRLSPEDAVKAGYPADAPVYADAYGNVSSEAKPVAVVNQAATMPLTPFQKATLAHENAASAETARHNRASESDEMPDPGTVDYWAQSVAAGQPLPALGMGKAAASYRQAILKRAAEINSGKGLTGVDQNVAIATTKANSGSLGKQTALRTATEGFENTMLQNMNVVRDLLKKGAGTTGIPVLNRYQQYVRGQYQGDPDVVALANAIDTVADENAKIRSGTLGNTPATDAMRANIKDGLNKSMTPDQILGAFSVMEKDAGNRSRALRAQEEALKSGLKGKSDLPQIPGIREPQASAPGVPSPQSVPRVSQPNKTKTGVGFKILGN